MQVKHTDENYKHLLVFKIQQIFFESFEKYTTIITFPFPLYYILCFTFPTLFGQFLDTHFAVKQVSELDFLYFVLIKSIPNQTLFIILVTIPVQIWKQGL